MGPAQHTSPRSRPRKRIGTKKKTTSTLDEVREGIRRFIVSDASIGDFHRALRSAAGTGKLSPHPLTGPALRKIINEAMNDRKRIAKKRRVR